MSENNDTINQSLFVSVVVPAMNEEGNIDRLCELFAAMFRDADFPGELILVNDGSTDQTLRKIREQAEKYDFIKWRSFPRNRGLTEALNKGFEAARGDIFVFYPADLQFLPEDIPAMIAKMRDGADVVTGWKQGAYRKRFVSSIYNWLSRALFGLKVHDLNSVKAFRSEIVERFFLRRDWHRYLVVLAADAGYVIDEVKVTLHERDWGESKFTSVWRIPIGIMDMIAVKFQIGFLRKPLLLFGGFGFLSLFLGFVVGLYALYLRFALGDGQRSLLYLVLLLVGVGIGMFILGLLAEALTGMREEITAIRNKLSRDSHKSKD